MNIRILLILLAISLLLAFTRRWRIPGMVSSAVLVVLLVWFTVNQPATTRASGFSATPVASSSVSRALLPLPLANLQLEGNGAPWRLSGSVANPGEAPIRSVTLRVERLDCPSADAAESDCILVWRGQHTLRTRVDAKHSTKIDDNFYSHDAVPRLKGVARDYITVISVQ